VDIGRKHAGYIPMDEYSADPTANAAAELKVGDELDLIIMKTNDAEGTVMLSKRRFDAQKAWVDIIEAEEDGRILEGTVAEVIKGGVLVVCNNVRVFVPASLATERRDEELESLLKKSVKFRIIEVNKQRRRAVGSIRSVLRDAKKEASEAFWAQAAEGQKYSGVVKSMTNYGAFVDIGGVDGMVHISEMSWKRIKNPSEVFAIGQEVDVYIKSLDAENKKISLGYRKDEDNPWEILRKNYPEGTVIESEIVGLTTFGAFAKVIPGIDGLIHISQIADKHISKPQDVLKVGDSVTCKITAVDYDKKRVSLSIRALLEPVEEAAQAEEAPAEAPAEEAAEEAAE
ncbi:MAG: S1 RNA-binding domain-containing protein, partial [Clostridia bacterium]|nr:S1 RNA-binding domain-containing protein [Clostridia bacterium]